MNSEQPKYDLGELQKLLVDWENKLRRNSSVTDNVVMNSNLNKASRAVFNLKSSFLAPSYHYNNYVEIYNDFFIKKNRDLPGVVNMDLLYYPFIPMQIEFQSSIYSIKTLLDRLVIIISYYYTGISSRTTFGRIKETGGKSGLMSFALKLKDEDDLMNLIYENYLSWIRNAVEPRDRITHENDLPLSFEINLNDSEYINPIHMNSDLNEINNERNKNKDLDLSKLKFNIDSLYAFVFQVLGQLENKTPETKKAENNRG